MFLKIILFCLLSIDWSGVDAGFWQRPPAALADEAIALSEKCKALPMESDQWKDCQVDLASKMWKMKFGGWLLFKKCTYKDVKEEVMLYCWVWRGLSYTVIELCNNALHEGFSKHMIEEEERKQQHGNT